MIRIHLSSLWHLQITIDNFGHLLFEYHVEHALGAVGLQQFDNMWMLQHVTYCCLAFQIWNKKTCNKQKNKLHDFQLMKNALKFSIDNGESNSPAVLSPGLAVNFATSTILTANCNFDSRCMHLRTIEKGPLQIYGEKMIMLRFVLHVSTAASSGEYSDQHSEVVIKIRWKWTIGIADRHQRIDFYEQTISATQFSEAACLSHHFCFAFAFDSVCLTMYRLQGTNLI